MQAVRRLMAPWIHASPSSTSACSRSASSRSVVNERLIASLSATLSAMATLLSVVGLYGVMAYMVSRRTREIGIRMALGALSLTDSRSVLREAGALVAIGLDVGFGAAWWLGRYVQSQLYGVEPADTATILIAALTLVPSPASLGAAGPPGSRGCRRCRRCVRTD